MTATTTTMMVDGMERAGMVMAMMRSRVWYGYTHTRRCDDVRLWGSFTIKTASSTVECWLWLLLLLLLLDSPAFWDLSQISSKTRDICINNDTTHKVLIIPPSAVSWNDAAVDVLLLLLLLLKFMCCLLLVCGI